MFIVRIKNYVKMIIVKIVLINPLLVTQNHNFGIKKKIIKNLDNTLKVVIVNVGLNVVNVNINLIID